MKTDHRKQIMGTRTAKNKIKINTLANPQQLPAAMLITGIILIQMVTG